MATIKHIIHGIHNRRFNVSSIQSPTQFVMDDMLLGKKYYIITNGVTERDEMINWSEST